MVGGELLVSVKLLSPNYPCQILNVSFASSRNLPQPFSLSHEFRPGIKAVRAKLLRVLKMANKALSIPAEHHAQESSKTEEGSSSPSLPSDDYLCGDRLQRCKERP